MSTKNHLVGIITLMLALFAAAFPAAAHHRHARIPGFAVLLHHHKHHLTLKEGGRPAAWCGWFMRRLVNQDPGPAYNLARNWAHWGSPSNVIPGAVVVYRHHVVKVIEVRSNNRILAISGNDGHAVRIRERSLANAIAVRS